MTVRRHTAIFPGLMLIHCSAGVGRTGTLIALDILLQCIRAKKKIDVFGVVLQLRAQRAFMVQNQDQYKFIYKCLKDSLDNPTLYTFKTSCSATELVSRALARNMRLELVKKMLPLRK